MERLTYWNEEYGCWSYHCPSGEAAIKLAAYEDTGLEPSDVPTALEMANVFCALEKLKAYEDAEEQGRLVNVDCMKEAIEDASMLNCDETKYRYELGKNCLDAFLNDCIKYAEAKLREMEDMNNGID